MPLPDTSYVYCPPIQTYFVDKDTGAPLSGGSVYFYSDTNRTTLKPIYQQVQQPDNTYLFVELANPVTLTSVGTFGNEDGDDINVYLYPYEGTPADTTRGEIELYYIVVRDVDGVLQETREAFPPNVEIFNPEDAGTSPNENQISNPQFVEISYTPDVGATSYTFSVSTAGQETVIAPDWSIITTGTGNVTVEQVAITDSTVPSSPPYALDINSSGAALTQIQLRQRITASPRLFYGKIVSGLVVAKSVTDHQTNNITMTYVPSSEESYTIFNKFTTADAQFTTLQDTKSLDGTPSSSTAPNGYVDIIITFPVLSHIQITSIQLVEAELAGQQLIFAEESTSRQIDHLYHDAYPIVPVGTIIDYFGFSVPDHYLLCDYTAYNRITYSQLFNTITARETVTLTSGVNTFTVADESIYSIGYGIEGTGIPAQSTITNISGTTITMTQNATQNGSQNLRFFAAGNKLSEHPTGLTSGVNTFTVVDGSIYAIGMSLTAFGVGTIPANTRITNIVGNTITMSANATATGTITNTLIYFYSPANGDGSTTFNVPDLRRRGTVGSGGTVISTFPPGVGNHWGNVGGEETHLQLAAEVGIHTHPPGSNSFFQTIGGAGANAYGAGALNPTTAATTGNNAGGTPFNIIQPALITNKCIRFE